MIKLKKRNTEAELKKNVVYEKACVLSKMAG